MNIHDATRFKTIMSDGVHTFVDRSMEWARKVGSIAEEEEIQRFCELLCGDYSCSPTGLHRRSDLARVFLPAGLVHAHIHDAVSGRLIAGMYDDGHQPVPASTIALAICTCDEVLEGKTKVHVTPRPQTIIGVLELALAFRA